MRGTLRGRSTIVYSLQGMCTCGLCVQDFIPIYRIPSHRRHHSVSPGISYAKAVQSTVDRIPETYKLTYQMKGHAQEGP